MQKVHLFQLFRARKAQQVHNKVPSHFQGKVWYSPPAPTPLGTGIPHSFVFFSEKPSSYSFVFFRIFFLSDVENILAFKIQQCPFISTLVLKKPWTWEGPVIPVLEAKTAMPEDPRVKGVLTFDSLVFVRAAGAT